MVYVLRDLAEKASPEEREVLLAAAGFIESIEIDNTAGVMGEEGEEYCACIGNVDVATLRALGFHDIPEEDQ